MKNYTGHQLIEARIKAGYETRDSFYQSLKVYLDKQNRKNEMPHYKTIQRMEKDNKFSKKSIKLICEFLSIPEEDLIKKNESSKKLNTKKNELPDYSNAFSRPFIIENSKQIKNIISKSNKRIILFDYNNENLAKNQDKAVGQLFKLIDNFASNQHDALDIILKHSFNSENALKTNQELEKINNLDYCLKGLSNGFGWVNDYEFDDLDNELEFLCNENITHTDNKKINPLYLYANSYEYTTYWPFPEYLYNKYMSTNEERPFLDDVYFPKTETYYGNDYVPGDIFSTFYPAQENKYRLTPVLIKYAIFIITANDIDIVYHPNKLQKLIEIESSDIIYGAPEDNKEYLFGKYYNGSYKKVLKDVQNDPIVPKNYLDPEDFKIIYGKSKTFEEAVARMMSKDTGKTIQIDGVDEIIDERKKQNDD